MPFLPSKTTYVRPLRENNDNTDCHRTFASPMCNKIQQFEVSENGNVIGFNGEVNLKNVDEVKKVYLENLNSIHSKLFSGVEEIQKWKTSVEMESKQKNKKIEEVLQTLEVQRKTILDLQLENENLSYQLSEEIQQRSFVLEKLHSTKELCSALKKHYNTLQGHYEYRNKIEEGFNIADAKRLSAIENLQNKFERMCREHSEKVGYLNDALASETNKALNLKETLEQQMAIFENEKESLCRMIENLQLEMQRISIEIDEERKKSKLVIEEKKIAKLQEKESEKKISALNETVLSLEDKICNIEAEMDKEKQSKEFLISSISILEKEKSNLESMISEAKEELTSYEQLKNEYRALEEQISEFSEKEKCFNITLENLNEELLQYKSEKERDFVLCNEKEENLKKMIQEYETKIVEADEKLKSVEKSNAELLHKIAILEKDLSAKTDETFIRDEKVLSLEFTVNSCQELLESLRCENISLKDKIEAEKVATCLECEQLATQLKQMENLNITLQNAEEALQKQKTENMEIMKMLNDAEDSYNNDRITKEKEIIKFQEQVRRLEQEMRIMNVKVEEFHTLKSLNQKQKEEIEELKFSITKQEEELNELKSEKEKLKGNLENFKYLTGNEVTLNENKENTTGSIKIEGQNEMCETKKNKRSKVHTGKKKRKTKNQNHLQNKSLEKDSIFSGLKEGVCEKKDTAKIPSQILNDDDIDSTSSGETDFGKNTSKAPETKLKDDVAVSKHLDSSKKNEKSTLLNMEKNKWEVDSSGSEYLELAFDKDSEKFMGLTPKKSPFSNSKLDSSATKKSSSFSSRLKRDNQCVNADNNAKKFGLPLKKNKIELGHPVWTQSITTPEKNADFWRVKENLQMKNVSAFNTPSTPADKRKIFSNTSTPSNQRKFFKTSLSDRDNKFKKPTSQAAWSDFLKSSK
ncbi:Synaptonemal complex protein 1 like protein [Argiope bruennichi]|uniref:Synaptonemal complex protein 1 like protein n=2 Tax=Argiope bruennichi TaxID=94029 RepID=A0A8T0ELX3_ARGBR|nr:Synaptonemal complex protein 1 like protein [Argiope bruennichi]